MTRRFAARMRLTRPHMTMNKKEQAVVDALGGLLADSYTLYLKTHSYHWNVTGPMFTT